MNEQVGPYRIIEGERYDLYDGEVDVFLHVVGLGFNRGGFSSKGCDPEGSGPESAKELMNDLNNAFRMGEISGQMQLDSLRAELKDANDCTECKADPIAAEDCVCGGSGHITDEVNGLKFAIKGGEKLFQLLRSDLLKANERFQKLAEYISSGDPNLLNQHKTMTFITELEKS